MAIFKVYPVGEGKHNNVHYIARDKKNSLVFKIVAFPESENAYILQYSSKVNVAILKTDTIHNELIHGMLKYGFNLRTSCNDIFKSYANTEELLQTVDVFDITLRYDENLN